MSAPNWRGNLRHNKFRSWLHLPCAIALAVLAHVLCAICAGPFHAQAIPFLVIAASTHDT